MSGRRAKRTLSPTVLRWARERNGFQPETLAAKVGVQTARVLEWERSGRISVAQADRLAQRTHTPIGYLYLSEPPDDSLPIPDFRAPDGKPRRPSPDLLQTVNLMARRQAWLREELVEDGVDPLPFVGCCDAGSEPAAASAAMREHLDLEPGWATAQNSWAGALRHLRERSEAHGILVVFNGIVGNNTHRKLDPNEFQGFALVDNYAPLIFINGADFKAAQMFTLAHELAHVFVGTEGVSSFDDLGPQRHPTERFCNAAAAEFLVPEKDLVACWKRVGTISDSLQAVASRFKVSMLVAAWRTLDLELIHRDELRSFLLQYKRQLAQVPKKATGGNFQNSQNVRIGRRFGGAVLRAVKEDRLSYREAFDLTGLRGSAFDKFARTFEGAG